MKASELVEKLQKLIDEHGDVRVKANDTYYGEGYYTPVNNVSFRRNAIAIDIYEY